MITIGYKFISWDYGEENADIFLEKIERGETIHYSDLVDARGVNDPEYIEGIHFCATLEELLPWVKDALNEGVAAIEILEVFPIGEVKQRNYDNGRTAYVTDEVAAKILPDDKLPSEYLALFKEYFD
jgi:hypothetical protein